MNHFFLFATMEARYLGLNLDLSDQRNSDQILVARCGILKLTFRGDDITNPEQDKHDEGLLRDE